MKYNVRYTEVFIKSGLNYSELPEDLQGLIKKFNEVLAHWNKADEAEQQKFGAALVQSDALIAARIFGLKKVTVKVEPEKIDMEKLKELKAKMLLLNKKNNKK